MTDVRRSSLEELKLTPDELGRLKKAFGDPEFRKLFKEYADEISDPQNRKRYEEEIRLMESEQGIDVEFVNPVPDHCLKTRNWPSLQSSDGKTVVSTDEELEKLQGAKIFINVCKSDKVACPEMKPVKNSLGRNVPNSLVWSLPHCFTPPREDMDKNHKIATVYDVAFHPKAFELAVTSPAMRRLLDATAVEGVQRQFKLCLGKTATQAMNLLNVLKTSTDIYSDPQTERSERGAPRSENNVREEALLRAVHTLKGIAYKGVARPTVIRRRRADYEQRQKEVQKRTEEDLQSCSDPAQRQALRRLSSYRYQGRPSQSEGESAESVPGITDTTSKIVGPQVPKYTITYSSDFDLSDCRDAPDVRPIKPPDRLIVSVKLPGLTSSGCLDLDVTPTHLYLSSTKPIAYKLEVKFPYEVDDSKGNAKFNKSTNTLLVTVPLKQKTDESDGPVAPAIEEKLITDTSVSAESGESSEVPPKPDGGITASARRKRRKRRRRRSSTSDATDTSDSVASSSVQSDETLVRPIQPSSPEVLTVTEFETPVKSEKTATDKSAPQPADIQYGIQIRQVSIHQLVVPKERRIAPARFRQDPFSITMLLSVRGVVSDSVVLSWADSHEELTEEEPTSDVSAQVGIRKTTNENPLLLMITFSSRGAGGCTMDWGLVLRCPSKTEFLNVSDKIPPFFSPDSQSVAHGLPPKIISAKFSHGSLILVLKKPSTAISKEVPLSDIRPVASTLADRAVWWPSVAIGRTLNAGLQEYSFVGIENCLPFASSLPTSRPSPNAICDGHVSDHGYVNVSSLSADLCEVKWFRTEGREGSRGDCERSEDSPSEAHFFSNPRSPFSQTENPLSVHVPSCNKLHLRKENHTCPPIVLKGILKQRSYSESSCDEPSTPFGSLRDAGLADARTDPISSDDFPTASSDEERLPFDSPRNQTSFQEVYRRKHELCFRRCVSHEKLPSPSSAEGDDQIEKSGAPNGGRQRRRSVNFSSRDQHIAYSPRDTVEALRHTLASRRKKARRRETRRRYFSEDCTTTTSGGGKSQKQKSKSQRGDNQRLHFSSGNNSIPHSPDSQSVNLQVSGDRSTESADLNSKSEEKPILESNTVISVDVPHDESVSVAATETADKASVDPETSSRVGSPVPEIKKSDDHQTLSAVLLCANPILELDEE
ncbi:unnamed protein product [Calicophoron daubneyi]|uniref:Protein kintoun n=1 Tax=Calicophoron daubneyi TaxID=300641 RepID=A0AAV2TN99_CALDB